MEEYTISCPCCEFACVGSKKSIIRSLSRHSQTVVIHQLQVYSYNCTLCAVKFTNESCQLITAHVLFHFRHRRGNGNSTPVVFSALVDVIVHMAEDVDADMDVDVAEIDAEPNTQQTSNESEEDEDSTMGTDSLSNVDDIVDEDFTVQELEPTHLGPLLLSDEQIKYANELRFLLQCGVSDKCYRKFFVDSSFYDPSRHPLTLNTFRTKVIEYTSNIIKV